MYATVLEADDLLIEIQIPTLPVGMMSAYLRLHRYQRPTLGVAVSARIRSGTVDEVRMAVGCIGPKSTRLAELEAKIQGAKLSEAGRIVAEEKLYLRGLLRPVDDLLGSAEYKLHMTGVMLADALEQVCLGNSAPH
jgi:carbon-monoxide dehydrogenase medium subunit